MARGGNKGSRGGNKLRNPEGFGGLKEDANAGVPITVGANGKPINGLEDIPRGAKLPKGIEEGMNGEVLGYSEASMLKQYPELAKMVSGADAQGVEAVKRTVSGLMLRNADDNAGGSPDNSGYVVASGKVKIGDKEFLISGESEYGANEDGRVESLDGVQWYYHRIK